jgi:hypothetical protein
MAEVIDYIEFPSADRAASNRFFSAAFGWGMVSHGPDYDAFEGAESMAASTARPARLRRRSPSCAPKIWMTRSGG